jgi:hypothetical protein
LGRQSKDDDEDEYDLLTWESRINPSRGNLPSEVYGEQLIHFCCHQLLRCGASPFEHEQKERKKERKKGQVKFESVAARIGSR